jgi:pimeloyl-ACP methyl ester carboxylesterase
MGYDWGPPVARAEAGQPPEPGDLPPPTPRFLQWLTDNHDVPGGVEPDMGLFRVLNGEVRPFDEPAARRLLELAWSRAIDPSAARHHDQASREITADRRVPLSAITAPTTVIHGDQDQIFPLPHGEAVAAAIPGADLRVVPGMGHHLFAPGLPVEVADLIALPR